MLQQCTDILGCRVESFPQSPELPWASALGKQAPGLGFPQLYSQNRLLPLLLAGLLAQHHGTSGSGEFNA